MSPRDMRRELGLSSLLVAVACGGGANAPAETSRSQSPEGGASDAAVASDVASGWDDAAASDAAVASDAPVASDAAVAPPNTIGGCQLLPPSSPYHQIVGGQPPDPHSADYMSYIQAHLGDQCTNNGGLNMQVEPVYQLNVVPASQPMVPVAVHDQLHGWSGSGSFVNALTPSAAPIPDNPLLETVDTHMIVVQSGSCELYEFYKPVKGASGWTAYSGVRWDMTKDEMLPEGTASTTAAGTPLLPDIVRYDEVAGGRIDHALGFVASIAIVAKYAHVAPASDNEGICASPSDTYAFPYGGRLRLRSSYDTSKWMGSQAKVVAKALQEYGMILTDVACCFAYRIEDSPHWTPSDIGQLGTLKITDFEVAPMGAIQQRDVCSAAGCQ